MSTWDAPDADPLADVLEFKQAAEESSLFPAPLPAGEPADSFDRNLGCAFFGLSALCAFLFVTVAVLSWLIIAGVL